MIGESMVFLKKTGIMRMAAQTTINWNQDMPEIIKEIVTINKFKEIVPEVKY